MPMTIVPASRSWKAWGNLSVSVKATLQSIARGSSSNKTAALVDVSPPKPAKARAAQVPSKASRLHSSWRPGVRCSLGSEILMSTAQRPRLWPWFFLTMATRIISHRRIKKMIWTIELAPRTKLGSQTAIPSIQKAAARRPIVTLGGRGTRSELIKQKGDRS